MIVFDARGEPWREVLDEHRAPDSVRIEVRAWAVVDVIEGTSLIQPRSPRRVLTYARQVGIVATARKIASRLVAEASARRVSALGAGVVLEAPPERAALVGQPVMFFHPLCVDNPERVVLPINFVAAATQLIASQLPERFVRLGEGVHLCSAELKALSGRHLEALDAGAIALPAEEVGALLERLLPARAASTSTSARAPGPIVEHTASAADDDARAGVTLFGWGHHARTALIPHLTRRFKLARVHEVDPTLIPAGPARWAWDTAPLPRADDRAQLVVAAGWHHTHAPIAVSALERGAWALIEKPAVTTRAQLDALLGALEAQPMSRLFVAYHKRYAREGAYLRDDLRLNQPGAPMRYRALVHVVRLPERHWYRWPASGSRLLSNGCHTIDHFLWLNAWCPVESYELLSSPDDVIHATITLTSGAWMSLVLTEDGSDRLGTREVIEITRGPRMARIVDDHYQSEDGARVLRRARLDRMEPYQRMIDAVAHHIESNSPGDSAASVRMTHEVTLALDEALRERRAR